MIWLRKGAVHLLGIVLFVSLLGGVWALDINHNFSQPDKLKTWLHDSKIYNSAISATLKNAQTDQDKTGGDTSVSLTDPNIQTAAQQAFTPQLLEKNVNTFLDANYAWLQGKTDKPSFNIDLTAAKADFATRVGQFVEQRLAGLPACTSAEQAQLQIPVDPFTVSCRPANLNPTTEGSRVRDEINNNQSFLGQPNITADNVNKQDQAQASQQPYYLKLSNSPKLYQIGQKLPFILALLALLSAAGIIFLSLTRRKGWQRIGVILAVSGLILIVIKFVADGIAAALSNKSLNSGVAAQLKQPRDDLVHIIERELVKFDLIFGLIFVVLAVLIFVMLRRTSEDRPKPPVSANPETVPVINSPNNSDNPATPVRTVDDLPRFKQPQPKPKRPPRLIQ